MCPTVEIADNVLFTARSKAIGVNMNEPTPSKILLSPYDCGYQQRDLESIMMISEPITTGLQRPRASTGARSMPYEPIIYGLRLD